MKKKARPAARRPPARPLDRLELLVLAMLWTSRRSAGRDVDTVAAALARLAPSSSTWKAEVTAALDALIAAGLCTKAPHQVTRPGQRALGKAAGGAVPLRWSEMRVRLAGLALGAPTRRPAAADVRAAAIAAHHGIPPSRSLDAVVSGLVWRTLFHEDPPKKVTLAAIEDRVLRDAVGARAGTRRSALIERSAALAVNAASTTTDALTDAALRTWLGASKTTTTTTTTLELFARLVLEAAARVGEGRLGDHKVLISAVRRALVDGALGALDEGDFKQRLVDAHRAGLLTLHRADLVLPGMQEEIALSETRYLNARFHYVEDRAEKGTDR
ncbi:MAG: hypothetical protein Q8O67_33020 [Deltaproteobacteria bacterium]|nr:hypothetical protein [Deltaproteobacteria bacterium]